MDYAIVVVLDPIRVSWVKEKRVALFPLLVFK